MLKLLLGVCALSGSVRAADSGASVVVVYNTRVPESKGVAEYYAQRRQVPTNQIFGFDLPTTETMTRIEFVDRLQKPLLKELEAGKLFTFGPGLPESKPPARVLMAATIRYAALCYGVPTTILKDPTLVEEGTETLRPELRRNEASVDSQLACLPRSEQKLLWAGPMRNPFYPATNASLMHPTNGILLVTRLDGPSAAIARGLVDKAMDAETNGLWGRAYIDTRGLTNGEYRLGDDWMRGAAAIARRLGFETVVDENPDTFSAGFPMSQIALYAGWYDGQVSGPFTRPEVEFRPGAFAYHLHSFNAQTIRSASQNWVGPLLSKGATATLGSVDEPYLMATPDIAQFLNQFLFGAFSFGEAAYGAQNSVSWQNIAVGDPLYRPFGRRPDTLLPDLEKHQSKSLEWFYAHTVNLHLAGGGDLDEGIEYLEKVPLIRTSAVLKEKLGDLYAAKKKFRDGLDTYDAALKLSPSPQQKARLLLTLGQKRAIYGPEKAAYDSYQQFLKEFPDHPELLPVYQKFLPLAKRLGKPEDVERCEREIKRLTPPAPKP